MTRRGNPLVALAAVVLLPAAGLLGVWRFADGGPDTAPDATVPPTTVAPAVAASPPAPLATPLLSFRRVPGLLARELDGGTFAQDVAAFGNTLDATSCVVVELDGVEVASHNPDLPVIPASNQKLLTAAAALRVLGPDHTFSTDVRATGLSGGVVTGDLYLVGGGDPILATPDWDGNLIGYPVPEESTDLGVLAQQIAAAGVTRIDGSVVGDGARYDDQWYFDAWGDDIRIAEAGPISALLVNDGRAFDGSEWFVAESPERGAAHELTRLLRANGVTVAGEPDDGPTPDDAEPVTSLRSVSLPAVIAQMLSTSDNNTAEMLVKEMGLAAGEAGTTAAGLAAMGAALGELGIDASALVLADGSGLSNDNRVTCRAMTDILRLHTPTDDFARGLPVAAESGTLSEAFVDTAIAGRLVGKTGSLGNPPYNADPPAVKALSGYVPVEGGGTIQFALILNDPARNVADMSVNRPVWDAFADVLASYPSAPAAATLGPQG